MEKKGREGRKEGGREKGRGADRVLEELLAGVAAHEHRQHRLRARTHTISTPHRTPWASAVHTHRPH